jgi:hypothetical protein
MAKRTLAICAIFRDEAPYLKEWIDFHFKEGAEHFYLYNNFSVDNPERVLKPYIDAGIVTLINWPIPFIDGGQEKAYDDCIKRSKQSDVWVALIDIDEFLFSPVGTITSILERCLKYPALSVNTVCYGTSGKHQYEDVPVVKRFTRRAPLWWRRNRQRKLVIQPLLAHRAITPHRVLHDHGTDAYSVGGTSVSKIKGKRSKSEKSAFTRRLYKISKSIVSKQWLLRYIPSCLALFLDPYGGLKPRFNSISLLRINHYVLRSKGEYLQKRSRFMESQFGAKYNDAYLWYHDQNQIFDPILSNR